MAHEIAETLSFMHVGGTVADLDTALEEHAALGVGPWAVSETMELSTYDATRGQIVPQWTRAAYGKVRDGSAVELVEPSEQTPASPQRRLLDERAGINHIAYWCTDVPAGVGSLLASGAQLVTASVADSDVDVWKGLFAAGGEMALVPHMRACYVRLHTGAVVELVATSLLDGALQALFGPEIVDILPAPSATRSA